MQNKLLECVEFMITNIDMRRLIESQDLEKFILKFGDLLNYHQVDQSAMQNIMKNWYCCKCKKRIPDVFLTCTDYFCKQCLRTEIEQQTKGLIVLNKFELDLVAKCVVCQKKIPHEEYKALFLERWGEIEKNSKNREIEMEFQKSNKKQCGECKIARKFDDFFYECMHICIFCSSEQIRLGNSACPKCSCEKIPSKSLEKLIHAKCQTCKKQKSYIEDRLLKICKDHLHCYSCLLNAWTKVQCGVCEEILDSQSLQQINSQIFSKCFFCLNIIEAKYFMMKSCCLQNVCIYCQHISSKTNCACCGEILPIYQQLSLSFIES